MTTWAQVVNQHALNVISGDGTLQEALAQHFAPGFDGGNPGVPWQLVPPGTQSNWTVTLDDNSQVSSSSPPTAPAPRPNTPGNPYLGKSKLNGAAFIGLAIGVLGVTAANRLTNDAAFGSIKMWLLSADVTVDPDDMAGQFLQLAGCPTQLTNVPWPGALHGQTISPNSGYLTNTNAADGQPLMTTAQRDAIMVAWK